MALNLGTAIRRFATAITEAKPALNSIQIAQDDLFAVAHSIETGEASQGALRLFLACRDLYAAIGEAERDQELLAEIGDALNQRPVVYLDTVIISAMVKHDLTADELASMVAGEADETPRIPEDPRLQTVAVQLKGALSESDFNHLMQAFIAKAEFLLTGDGGVLSQKALASGAWNSRVKPSRTGI